MFYLNRRDEKERLYNTIVCSCDFRKGISGQDYTDTISYLGARKILKENGIIMAFDRLKSFNYDNLDIVIYKLIARKIDEETK